ncbi:MAG: carbon-nitrogen hydrolase family protein [Acidimicrobiia bacterium]|nr:carbon-nitrogen hydrolase family protein [Acidimicrobiia bacterium]
MRVAAIQMCSTPDKDRNLALAGDLIAGAAASGATLVALPELFNCWGSARELRDGAEPLDGPTIAWARKQASHHGITLLAGSIVERSARGGEHLHNASALIDEQGEVVATYRKIHLFDVDVPGAVHRESATITAGTDIVVADAGPLRIGMATCYDLRFPELFRAQLAGGANTVVLPSAFTAATGKDHWEPLLRARAIENQVFVIAPNQRGSSTEKLHWHGRSMIIDPWGIVLATAPDRDCFITADVDLDAQAKIRATLPSGNHRRPDLFGEL